MPDPLSLSRPLVAEDFLLSNRTIVLIKPLIAGASQPTLITVTVATGGVATGGSSVPLLAPLPDKLYAGTKLKFGGVEVIVKSDVLAGATAIPIEAAPATIAAAATAQDYFMIPVYSSMESNTEGGETTVKSSNFLSGDYENNLIAKLNWQMSISGDFIINDPGLAAIKNHWRLRRKCYIEIRNPNGQGGEKGTGFITKPNTKRKQDSNITFSFTIVGDGSLDEIPVTA
jgi:hypothetical protein